MFSNISLSSFQPIISDFNTEIETRISQPAQKNTITQQYDTSTSEKVKLHNNIVLKNNSSPHWAETILLTLSLRPLEQTVFPFAGLPSELWIYILDFLPLRDVFRFRRVSQQACALAHNALPISPRTKIFSTIENISTFLNEACYKNKCDDINILYQLVHFKQARCTDINKVKNILEKPIHQRTIEALIDARIFEGEQVKKLQSKVLRPEQVCYLTSSSIILERVYGTSFDMDTFLNIPDRYLQGGLTKALEEFWQQEIRQKGAEYEIALRFFLNTRDAFGYTPLHRATIDKDMDMVVVLLELGAQVNIRDYAGCMPLHYAAEAGLLNAVRFLLIKGAHAQVCDYMGYTPLLHAMVKGHLDIASRLFKNMTQFNHVDGAGGTALHYAVLWEDLSLCLALLQQKASVHICDKQGRNALFYAVRGKFSLVYDALYKEGVDVNQIDEHGLSALHIAAQNNGQEAAAFLIQHGALLNIPDLLGWTPLHHAVSRGHEKLAALLIDYGAAPDPVCNRGRTPLHYAAMIGNSPIVYKLLEAKASITAKDRDEKHPLHYAIQYLNINVARILITHRVARQYWG